MKHTRTPGAPERLVSTSVLVIGAGGSGLRAAIEAAEQGVDVVAVGKRPRHDAHTSLAAGGINAALGTMDPADSWQQHAADTIKESYFLADPRTVQIVTQGAEDGIRDLERYGMNFAREEDGRISQRFFGAHTYRRTAFAGDYTGLEIQRTLVDRAEELRIPIMDTVYVTRLLVDDGTVFGAYGFDLVDGTRYLIRADAVILAAGGHNRIWRRTSSRLDGDSFRLAVEAGGSAIPSSCSSTRPGSSSPRTRRGPWCPKPHGARAGSSATRSASASWRATTRSGWSSPRGTASPSPPSPRSRRDGGRPAAASGWTSRTSPARRS